MENEKQNFLEVHEAIVANNRTLLNRNGICFERFKSGRTADRLLYSPIFDLFIPSAQERGELKEENLSSAYWGYEEQIFTDAERLQKESEYTSFRETVILFCAAINEEL